MFDFLGTNVTVEERSSFVGNLGPVMVLLRKSDDRQSSPCPGQI